MSQQQAVFRYVPNPLNQLRKRFVQTLAIIAFTTSLGGLVAQAAAAGGIPLLASIAQTLTLFIVGLIAFVLVQRDQMRIAARLLIVVFTMVPLFVTNNNVLLLLYIMALITAATLAESRWEFIAVNLLVFGKLSYQLIQVIQVSGFETTDEGVALSITFSTLVIVSVATRFFITTAEQTAISAQRTSDLLQATAEVGQITSKMLTVDELFNRAVALIQDRFAFYHVQVFMIDENRAWANLIASTGEVGQQLLARQHRLQVGSQSVIGRVAQVGEPVIARDTDRDSVHARNELLPNTRAELALPILDGDTIIGALDVQSTRANAFDDTDIQALQVMANQLAVAIRNAGLFENQQRSLEENKRLFLEAETERREVQRLNSQLTRRAWDRYLQESTSDPSIAAEANAFVPQADWSPAMREAVTKQRPVTRWQDQQQIIAVPILLRGQVLGAIEIVSDGLDEEDTATMVRTVAQRLATSLDSIRLYDEAQRATAQEQRINEIVTGFQAAPTVDDLLRLTLEELGRTLDAEKSAIRLGTAARQNGHSPISNGSTPHD